MSLLDFMATTRGHGIQYLIMNIRMIVSCIENCEITNEDQ